MKKRKILCLSALAVLAALLLAVLLWPEGSSGIFYRVSGGEKEMYILGSIHIGSRSMYPMGEKIRTAMKHADLMVFECDTESTEAAEVTQRLMRFEEDDGLEAHISMECMQDLEKVAQKTGYDAQMLRRLKPWAITSLLSMETLAAQMGTRDVHQASDLGVEKQVRRAQGDAPVYYLETVEQQLGLMDAFSPELQEYLLSSACETILHPEEALDEELQLWPEWWADGNAQAFAASYLEGMETEDDPALAQEYHASLITQRNQSMAQKLDGLIQSGKGCFVTVGLMHLVLPNDSILDHLQAMGYQVEKIKN